MKNYIERCRAYEKNVRVDTAVATYINYCGKMMANLRGYIGIIYTLIQSNL